MCYYFSKSRLVYRDVTDIEDKNASAQDREAVKEPLLQSPADEIPENSAPGSSA